MLLGYIRQSAKGPPQQQQRDELEAAGCARYFVESDRKKRPGLAAAIQSMRFGDTLVVTSLDRLAWAWKDLAAVAHAIHERGGGLRSLAEPFADPTTEGGRYFLELLDGLAAFERFAFADRMATTRAEAAANGVRLHRPLRMTPEVMAEVRERYEAGEKMAEIGAALGFHISTISRVINPKAPKTS